MQQAQAKIVPLPMRGAKTKRVWLAWIDPPTDGRELQARCPITPGVDDPPGVKVRCMNGEWQQLRTNSGMRTAHGTRARWMRMSFVPTQYAII